MPLIRSRQSSLQLGNNLSNERSTSLSDESWSWKHKRPLISKLFECDECSSCFQRAVDIVKIFHWTPWRDCIDRNSGSAEKRRSWKRWWRRIGIAVRYKEHRATSQIIHDTGRRNERKRTQVKRKKARSAFSDSKEHRGNETKKTSSHFTLNLTQQIKRKCAENSKALMRLLQDELTQCLGLKPNFRKLSLPARNVRLSKKRSSSSFSSYIDLTFTLLLIFFQIKTIDECGYLFTRHTHLFYQQAKENETKRRKNRSAEWEVRSNRQRTACKGERKERVAREETNQSFKAVVIRHGVSEEKVWR